MQARVNEQKKSVTRQVKRRKPQTPFQIIRQFFGDHFLPTSENDLKRLEKAIRSIDPNDLSLNELYYMIDLYGNFKVFRKAIAIIPKVHIEKKLSHNHQKKATPIRIGAAFNPK